MCTVVYIPQSRDKYLFATSRDEHRDRPEALPPAWHDTEHGPLFFPRDPVGGGSWIAANDKFTLCILNGAFQPHERQPPYRHSRGEIPIHFLKYGNVRDFFDHYQFEGLEAFTFLIIDDRNLHEIRWDQQEVHYRKYQKVESRIWASAPLYDEKMLEMRKEWFRDFQENHQPVTCTDVLNFYLHGGNGDPHSGLMINRKNGVKTVSISCVEKEESTVRFHYRTGEKTMGLEL
jgi:uncharacterized protein with NRDE domain